MEKFSLMVFYTCALNIYFPESDKSRYSSIMHAEVFNLVWMIWIEINDVEYLSPYICYQYIYYLHISHQDMINSVSFQKRKPFSRILKQISPHAPCHSCAMQLGQAFSAVPPRHWVWLLAIQDEPSQHQLSASPGALSNLPFCSLILVQCCNQCLWEYGSYKQL